jgi:hypothetical protein
MTASDFVQVVHNSVLFGKAPTPRRVTPIYYVSSDLVALRKR